MDSTNEAQVMTYVQENMDNIPFKTLRRGEQDLTREEKLVHMQKTLHHDPALFLSKWGRYLSQRILILFQQIQNNYEVDYHLDSLIYSEEEQPTNAADTNRPSRHKRSELYNLVQNRRYEFLKQHLRNSDYFSDESIQLRDPILYDQFIGQHIPAREKNEPFANDITLVNRILSNIDKKYVDDHLEQQKIVDEEQMEEEEEDDSEDEIFIKSTPVIMTKRKEKDVEMTDPSPENEKEDDSEEDEDEEDEEDEEERDVEALMEFREEQRLELIRLLEEKFLAGKDDFDYDQVDYNEEYDDLEQQERDIQDRYFDED